jgi:hypothetical protein
LSTSRYSASIRAFSSSNRRSSSFFMTPLA